MVKEVERLRNEYESEHETINVDQFTEIVSPYLLDQRKVDEELLKTFKVLDRGKGQVVTLEELQIVMQKLGEEFTDERYVEELIRDDFPVLWSGFDARTDIRGRFIGPGESWDDPPREIGTWLEAKFSWENAR